MYQEFEETIIFKKLNKLKYDSCTPKFVDIESIVISMIDIDRVLQFCKVEFPKERDFHEFEQNMINGMGLLQLLVYQQNCLKKLYKDLTGGNLVFTKEIKDIRELRNSIVGHPDERGYIPRFYDMFCDACSFDEESEMGIFIYSDLIDIQDKYINNIIDYLVDYTNISNE